MKTVNPEQGFGTLLNHVGEHHHPLSAHVMPIFQTSTFSFDTVQAAVNSFTGVDKESYVYTRGRNPNSALLAQKVAYLEGIDLIRAAPDKDVYDIVDAYVCGSGMGAITAAVLSRMKAGDKALVQASIYGGTHTFWSEIAPRYGMSAQFVQSFDLQDWKQAFVDAGDISVVYVESPANPTMEVQDLRGLADLAHEHGAWLIVDNTFATPYHQRPLGFGADMVVHSSTKYIGGHGVATGGIIVCRHPDFVNLFSDLWQLASELGASPSPNDSWLMAMGLKTLELRMQRHSSNAMQIARFMQEHKKIKTVLYPGLPDFKYHEMAKKQMQNGYGGLVSFELSGGASSAAKFIDLLTLPAIAISLGSTDSLIQCPASMTHRNMPKAEREAAGITDGLIRFSVGIENVEDLIADLDQALNQI